MNKIKYDYEIFGTCINCIIRTIKGKKIEYIATCKLFPLNTDTEYKDVIGTYEECKDIVHSGKCEYKNYNKDIK